MNEEYTSSPSHGKQQYLYDKLETEFMGPFSPATKTEEVRRGQFVAIIERDKKRERLKEEPNLSKQMAKGKRRRKVEMEVKMTMVREGRPEDMTYLSNTV